MNLMTMRFKNFIWPDNPSQLEVKAERLIKTKMIPFSQENAENLGLMGRRVTGKGYFTGEDSMQKFQQLEAIFQEGSAGSLQLPDSLPFRAVMDSLTRIGNAGSRAVGYTFSFIEQKSKSAKGENHVVLASEGESLWTFAQQFSVPIEKLVALNPHIRDIASLKQGEKVVLS